MAFSEPSAAQPRKATILGATGSIGRAALAIIDKDSEKFSVETLTAKSDVAGLAELARHHKARRAVIADTTCLPALRDALAGSGIEAVAGESALTEAAEGEAEWVLAAMSGVAGLAPALAAAKAGKMLALANKEAVISAGDLLTQTIKKSGGVLIPVDSEHHALFQMLTPDGESLPAEKLPAKLILTATGGPFRDWSSEEMAKATPEQACAHPVWPMGRKISVDSATLMNKSLELIEAHYLFNMPAQGLEMIIHPQALVHALIVQHNHATIAHIGPADMAQPISTALAFPGCSGQLNANPPASDLASLPPLQFLPVDEKRFPAAALARAVLQSGGAMTTILNAANEAAVEAFLAQQTGFGDIIPLVAQVLETPDLQSATPPATMAEITRLDNAARKRVHKLVARHV